MKKTFLCIFVLFAQLLLSQTTLKIENFVENGDGTVTFDIMMKNDEEVAGVELNIFSGQGVFDSGDECICQLGNVPDGCTECYFDNGLDFVKNSYEEGYATASSQDYNGCVESGECANATFSDESNCEAEGLCNGNGRSSSDDFCYINGIIELTFADSVSCIAAGLDSSGDVCDGTADDCTALGDWDAYSPSDCTDSGSCSDGNYTSECDCVQNDEVWTSDDYVWSPDDLWSSYDLPYLCDENGYDWNYANQDASGDDYRVLVDPSTCSSGGINCGAFPDNPCCTSEFQFCRLPGINSTDPSSSTVYQDYAGLGSDVNTYDISGHCSQVDSYCRDLDGCTESQGLSCDNGFPQSCCNNSANPDWSWQSPYRDYVTCIENGFTWTPYDTQQDCEAWGGFWVGSETGAQGNSMFDLGENFVDYDQSISVSSVSNPAGGLTPSSNSSGTILMFDFGGASIPSSDEYERLITVNAAVTGSIGDVVTLGARKVCNDNYQNNCIETFALANSSGGQIDTEFMPHIWTIGTGAYSLDSSEAANDGFCSVYAGETIATDSSCSIVCGDNVCSASENYSNCKMDCPDPVDGDGYCNLYEGENVGTSSDCVAFGCGDYYCDQATEGLDLAINTTGSVCNLDCLSVCGDGYCDEVGGENFANCGQDCGDFTTNDGLCSSDSGETYCNSPADCVSGSGADGDGCYDYLGGEDGTSQDYQITCGDSVYHYDGLTINEITADSDNAESYIDCMQDYVQTCGDGYYDHSGTDTAGSETDSCSLDYVSTLGDGVCDVSENPGTDAACVAACETSLTGCCGDGFYHHAGNTNPGTEDDISCPADYVPSKNDGVCDGSSGTGVSQPDGNGENIVADAASCTETVYTANGWSLCGDGACDVGFGNTQEDSSSCPADCAGLDDNVCARYNTLGIDGAALENAYTHDECTYDDTAFDVCGDGVCNDGVDSDYDWGEFAGVASIGQCDQDCLTDNFCDFVESDNTNSLYDYDECFECSDSALDDDSDGCQDGFGESSDPASADFCIDCWTGCGDGVCDGPENYENCAAQGGFEFIEGPPFGDFIFSVNGGDCIDPSLSASSQLPRQYYLSANYPNPFNPVTTINYSVENADNVKIDIYNVLGQHVYTLVDGYHLPGAVYQVTWSPEGQSNLPVSSGVYFYKMVSGSFVDEGRMTIVK